MQLFPYWVARQKVIQWTTIVINGGCAVPYPHDHVWIWICTCSCTAAKILSSFPHLISRLTWMTWTAVRNFNSSHCLRAYSSARSVSPQIPSQLQDPFFFPVCAQNTCNVYYYRGFVLWIILSAFHTEYCQLNLGRCQKM